MQEKSDHAAVIFHSLISFEI